MTLIKVKKYTVPTLKTLNFLVTKFIFEKESITPVQRELIGIGIEKWQKKAMMFPWERNELNNILAAMIKNEKGGFNQLKESLKKANIHYRQVFDEGI